MKFKTLDIIFKFLIGLVCLYAAKFLILLGVSEFVNGEYYMVLFAWTVVGFYSAPFIIVLIILVDIFRYFASKKIGNV